MTRNDSIAIVVGGTAGVGRAVVEAFLAEGYRVGVVARGEARLQAMENEFPGRVKTASADAGVAEQLDRATDNLVQALGIPRAWINCAMLTSFSPFEMMEVEEFEQITRATYLGQVNGTRAALRVMGRGNIVNVGSGLGYRAIPFQSAYSGAKHAINGFTAAVRSELMRDGHPVKLSLVQLPAMNTPQFDWARNRLPERPQPAPPVFQPEVAARAVLRAIETGPRELLVGKSVLQLVFGDMVLPDWLDRKLADEGVEMQKSGERDSGNRPDNIYEPVDHPSTAHGRFEKRAKDSGIIVDGDVARKVVFFGIPAVAFLSGAVIF
ncbi:SDR family oxidoreductase [Roseitranquillus sediminis]|uniref:SDR family oxidoreductase n=1 Tax=Roseitranquillus sediminis TaxID=2809051 RepID=UPI001D0CD8A1|nr:SDR family oxidoreductase [Roseitranquillus sediminis]MBM9596377.1 SDR family NAD(P)-dependent oxidoreductase [Roseitranquillus sediminis]